MLSLRLFVFSPDGLLHTLFLPQNLDGRYKFEALPNQKELPLFVESSGNGCVLHCTENADFFEPDGLSGKLKIIGKKHPLDQSALKFCKYFRSEGAIYTVYVELANEGDNALVPYYFEPIPMDYTIGRNGDNAIVYVQRDVSRSHAAIRWNGANWEIRDLQSTNGVFVNGKIVSSKVLRLGDIVFIMGMYIVVGNNYFAINNAGDRVEINTPHIRRIVSRDKNNVVFSAPGAAREERVFDRPPRKVIRLEPKPIEIEMPPVKMSANRMPLLLRLGSPLVMGGKALVTGNFLYAITGLLLPVLTQGMTEKDRKDYEDKRRELYLAYLKSKSEEIEKERMTELSTMNSAHPGVMETLAFAINKRRLWERRTIDEDFLTIRMGAGNLPLMAERVYEKKKFELERDDLVDLMYELAQKPVTLSKAPVLLSFKDDFIVGVNGKKDRIIPLVRNLILQLVSTHSYDELKICILADEDYARELNFVRYFRHNWDDDMSVRFFGTTLEELQPMANYFRSKETEYLGADTSSTSRWTQKNEPAFVVFALSKSLYDSLEFLKDVRSNLDYHGISIVAAFDGLPKECSKIIETDSQMRIIDLKHPEKQEAWFTPDEYNQVLAESCIKELYYTKLKSKAELAELPPMVTFLELFRVGRVEYLNPLSRWKENNPIKSLAAPIGVSADGSIFTLDLHEKRQGPHGLIAGMTGSGKSEFIITYILSMAVNYRPEEVAFILIDYKGGGLTDAFENKARGIHLPHVVGTITNLDGAAIKRSLMSINSELKRRQAAFKKAKTDNNEGTMDIYDYQKLYRSGKVAEPMPHLFIISDEFAELKKQQPEFMDELISTARIGRSLGVHLILATQKPSGVVNDQIWSNTKFRVCLKVQDRSDSMEMLKRPEAAELKQTGRFYLQVGYNEYFALGQSAWCGAGYYPQDEVVKEEDNSVTFVDTAGRVILNAKPKVEKRKAESKQIGAIVQYLSDLAKREKMEIQSLWLEPLADKIDFCSVEDAKRETITATIGVVDDPEFQAQYPMEIDLQSFHHMLLVGGSGSGKSTLIRTMLYSLTTKYSPEDVNYYLVDLSAGALSAMKAMPHCGAYLTEENEGDFDRLLKLIRETVEERKKLFSEADVFGFEAYRKVAPLPLILVVIDGWTNIGNFQKGQDYSLSIGTYMREAAGYGIRFILTLNHINQLSSRARLELDYSLILQPKDKYDYNDVLNVRGTMLPPQLPGRGMCVIDGRPLEFHVAVPNVEKSDAEQNAFLKDTAKRLAAQFSDCHMVRHLATVVEGMEYADFCEGVAQGRLPLGFSMETTEKISLPLQQMVTASVFFGNPVGVRPVFSNFILAFYRENADVIIVRRMSESIFSAKPVEQLREMLENRVTVLDCAEESFDVLDDLIIQNIKNGKMKLRNEFCERNGISPADKGRTKKAGKYIRAHSRPLFVLFESLPDFLRLKRSENQEKEFAGLFEQLQGYNIYFIGAFYPEDESMTANPLFRSFTKNDFAMLFGGRYHKAWCTSLPGEYKRMEIINPRYDRFVMKYHEKCYRMLMPCGELISASGDPDEADII